MDKTILRGSNMAFYIFLTIVCYNVAYVSHLSYKHNMENKLVQNFIDFAPYLILIIITGFRHNVGTDYKGYVSNFYYLKNNDIPRIEITFKIIVKLAHLLGFNYQFVFLTYAVITFIFIFLGVRYFDKEGRYRHYIVIFMSTFFLFNIFNSIRQMAAASICFYASKYFIEKKIHKYIILMFFATLFHTSAIFCVLLHFTTKINVKYLTVALTISPLFIFTNIANLILSFLVNFSGFSYYGVYLDRYNYQVAISGGAGLLLFYLIGLFLGYTIETSNYDYREKYIIKMFMLYTSLTFVTLSSVITTRIIYYPMFSLLFAIPLLLKYSKQKTELLLFKYMVSLLSWVLFINTLFGYRNLFIQNQLLHYSFNIFT